VGLEARKILIFILVGKDSHRSARNRFKQRNGTGVVTGFVEVKRTTLGDCNLSRVSTPGGLKREKDVTYVYYVEAHLP
jgi:hypothetical protein